VAVVVRPAVLAIAVVAVLPVLAPTVVVAALVVALVVVAVVVALGVFPVAPGAVIATVGALHRRDRAVRRRRGGSGRARDAGADREDEQEQTKMPKELVHGRLLVLVPGATAGNWPHG
jgi:hypothetical protein